MRQKYVVFSAASALLMLWFSVLAATASASMAHPNYLSWNGQCGIASWRIEVKQGTSTVTIPIIVVMGYDGQWDRWMYVIVDHSNGAGTAWAIGERTQLSSLPFTNYGATTATLNFKYGSDQSAWHTIEITLDLGGSATYFPSIFMGFGTGCSVYLSNGFVEPMSACLSVDYGSHVNYLADEAYWLFGDIQVFLP